MYLYASNFFFILLLPHKFLLILLPTLEHSPIQNLLIFLYTYQYFYHIHVMPLFLSILSTFLLSHQLNLHNHSSDFLIKILNRPGFFISLFLSFLSNILHNLPEFSRPRTGHTYVYFSGFLPYLLISSIIRFSHSSGQLIRYYAGLTFSSKQQRNNLVPLKTLPCDRLNNDHLVL